MNDNKHISEKDVIEGHFLGGGYAFYRLPNAENYTFVSQQGRPEELVALDISDTFSGIVIAPFCSDTECPILLLKPDFHTHNTIPSFFKKKKQAHYTNDNERRHENYLKSYSLCHKSLDMEEALKVVLSRRMSLLNISDSPWNPVELFFEACTCYPQSYITLWWTQRTGCWLVATPETLLKKTTKNIWETMALAGTMKWDECNEAGLDKAWSQKNKDEQQYVTNYIKKKLLPYTNHLVVSPTYTARAADLAHLRTDFQFEVREGTFIGDLLNQLHPTPAVCGVPKESAHNIILRSEDSPRRYYAGFSGPINFDGNSQLYVSLRCMEITPRSALLYAGGGILKESLAEEEWTETQRKMNTMLHLF